MKHLSIRDFQFQPVASMDVPLWADEYRRLPSASAAPGRWKTSSVEVARGPMQAWSEPGVRTLTLCWGVQMGKSELVLNLIGRTAHLDPAPMMMVLPKRDAADKWSRERLTPLIRECPALARKFDPRTRMGEDSLAFKQFTGGFLAVESAGSPMDLASRAIKYVFCEEIDKFEMTKEGEPVQLAEARLKTFGPLAKSVRVCSPTLTEKSRIWQSYLKSDQRRAFIACEHCGYEMNVRFFQHVQWSKSESGEHFPATAAIYCEKCGTAWSEDYRRKAITTKLGIKWKQTRPFKCCDVEQSPLEIQRWEWDAENQIGYALCGECGERAVPNVHAGYQAGQIFSPFVTIPTLVDEWIKACSNPDDKLTFRNTNLGEPGDPELVIENVKIADLMARRENFPKLLPSEICGLFTGVDVQTGSDVSDGSLHAYIWGVGIDRQMWSVNNRIFTGDVRLPAVWDQLDEYLSLAFDHECGGPMIQQAVAIDAGDGKISEVVVDFCRKRRGRNIFAIKGASDTSSASWGAIWPGVTAKKSRETGYRVKVVGSNSAKLAIYSRLEIAELGAGYMHFGLDWDIARFEQLTAEKLSRLKRGEFEFRKFILPRGRANEALDATAYALVAMHGWIARGQSLEKSRRYLDQLMEKPSVQT